MTFPPDETTEPESIDPAPTEAEPEMPPNTISDRLLVAALYAAPMLGVILTLQGILPGLSWRWETAYLIVLSWHLVWWTTLGRRLQPWRIAVMIVVFFIVDRVIVLFSNSEWVLVYATSWQSSFAMLLFAWICLLLLRRIGLEIRRADLDWDPSPWWRFSLRSLFLWTIVVAMFLAFGLPPLMNDIQLWTDFSRNVPNWFGGAMLFTRIWNFAAGLFLFLASAWLILGIGPIRRRMLPFAAVLISNPVGELIQVAFLFLLEYTQYNAVDFSSVDIGYLWGSFYGFVVCGLWHLAGFLILRRRGFRVFWRRRPI